MGQRWKITTDEEAHGCWNNKQYHLLTKTQTDYDSITERLLCFGYHGISHLFVNDKLLLCCSHSFILNKNML